MASGWSSDRDLFLDLDGSGRLRDGIERALRDALREGRIALGSVLPSSRSLARDLGVARGTVSAAYAQLAAEGYLELGQGSPARVRWIPHRQAARPQPPAPRADPWWDLRPGRPDSASFPRQAWARAHREVLTREPDEIFGYADPRGSSQLRQVLADYLARTRAVATDPERLMICSGFTQALALTCRVLRDAGATTLAVEDPSPPRYRQLAEASGLAVLPVPCDLQGLNTAYLADINAHAVLVTPAHQYPLGVTMSAARRTALVEWARRGRALIIEDDYDGEFRYDRPPVGALQHLDPEHIIYIGTASKTLAPALRLGWMTLPARFSAPFTTAKDRADRGTSVLDQLTLAELIATGAFDRHIRHMRASYRRRRDELASSLTRATPSLRLTGISAGLHALAYLPEHGPTEQQIHSRATQHSLALHTLGDYWHNPPEPVPQAIIIGYATPAGHSYHPALNALNQLLTNAADGTP